MNSVAIFDLDGTLADTALDLLNAGNLTFEEIGINYRLKENRDEGISSKGGRSTIRQGLLQDNGFIDEQLVENLYPKFLKNYEKVIDDNSESSMVSITVVDSSESGSPSLSILILIISGCFLSYSVFRRSKLDDPEIPKWT